MSEPQRVHKGRQALEYMQQNANRPVTIDEVAREIGWSANSVSSALGRALEAYPKHLTRVTNRRGVYVWYATAGDREAALRGNAPADRPTHKRTPQSSTAPTLPSEDEIILKVVARKDGALLVQDVDTQSVYKLTPFKF